MSQITCCPACATLFRVTDGQLQAAQGWVRCGQCGEVFEALLHQAPGSAPPPPSPGELAAPSPPSSAVPAPAAIAAHPPTPGLAGPVAASASGEGRQEPVLHAEGFAATPPGPAAQAVPDPDASLAQHGPQAFPDVAFVQAARRDAASESPRMRRVLGMACLALAVLLALQWAGRQKDALAAQAPWLIPWIQALCRPLGCELRPLRRIESLVIENASFSRTGPDAYRLSFAFKNTGPLVLEVPALEVTLTDSQDQAVVRRVVMPAEFGASQATLAPYSRLDGALALRLSVPGGQAPAPFRPVTGYRILAFYP